MLAFSFTRLIVTPGCALSKALIILSVNRLLRKLGIATVSFTLLSWSAGALPAGTCVGVVLSIDVADRRLTITTTATTITIVIGTRIRAKRLKFHMEVMPQLQVSERAYVPLHSKAGRRDISTLRPLESLEDELVELQCPQNVQFCRVACRQDCG